MNDLGKELSIMNGSVVSFSLLSINRQSKGFSSQADWFIVCYKVTIMPRHKRIIDNTLVIAKADIFIGFNTH
jgi:hypothetical protein